jgi:hypothetical protein
MSVTSAEKAEPAVPRNFRWSFEFDHELGATRFQLRWEMDGVVFYENQIVRQHEQQFADEIIQYVVQRAFDTADRIAAGKEVRGQESLH